MNVFRPDRRWMLSYSACGLLALSAAGTATADQPNGSKTAWHLLTDRQRGLRIVSGALAWDGQWGDQCKIWVQTIVRDVTGEHVTVPTNTAEVTHRWNTDKTGHIQDLGASITVARPGDIVQMVTRDRDGVSISHTAIVASNSRKSITWLESNFRGDEKVTTNRSQSHKEFQSSLVDGLYTVYRIK